MRKPEILLLQMILTLRKLNLQVLQKSLLLKLM